MTNSDRGQFLTLLPIEWAEMEEVSLEALLMKLINWLILSRRRLVTTHNSKTITLFKETTQQPTKIGCLTSTQKQQSQLKWDYSWLKRKKFIVPKYDFSQQYTDDWLKQEGPEERKGISGNIKVHRKEKEGRVS